MFKVNPASFAGVTVLPAEIAQRHLILAGAPQLKVIIFAYHNAAAPVSVQQTAQSTGFPRRRRRMRWAIGQGSDCCLKTTPSRCSLNSLKRNKKRKKRRRKRPRKSR